MSLLDQLNLPKFAHITLPEYQTLATKDSNTLYFIKGTSLVYRGTAPYGSSIKRVVTLPAAADAMPELHYFVTEGDEAGIYCLNSAMNGFVNITVTRKYISDAVGEFFNNVDYDEGKLIFKRPGGEDIEIDIPTCNFLEAASFDAKTSILTLTLADETVVPVDLSKLMNVYTGGETDTATVEVAEDGEITVDVNISGDVGNSLEAKPNGLYVKVPPVAATVSDASTNDQVAGAKLVYDIVSTLAWKETV